MITFETYRGDDGGFRWRIRHQNGNIMGDSSDPNGYANEADRDQAIETITGSISSGNFEVKAVDA